MVTGKTADETQENIDRLAEEGEELVRNQKEIEQLTNDMKNASFSHIMSDYDAIMNLSKNLNINATEARKQLPSFPAEYSFDGETVPDLVKKMRNVR